MGGNKQVKCQGDVVAASHFVDTNPRAGGNTSKAVFISSIKKPKISFRVLTEFHWPQLYPSHVFHDPGTGQLDYRQELSDPIECLR